jgi:hypothetical protein
VQRGAVQTLLIKGSVMKAAISLLFLSVGMCAYADQAQFDPAYLNDGVYKQETDEFAFSESIYNGEIDDPAIIQVGGGEPCTYNTPVGGSCVCNGFVTSRHPLPYYVPVHKFLFIKANWHLTNIKGMHAGGNICTKDREATPEERPSFVRNFRARQH